MLVIDFRQKCWGIDKDRGSKYVLWTLPGGRLSFLACSFGLTALFITECLNQCCTCLSRCGKSVVRQGKVCCNNTSGEGPGALARSWGKGQRWRDGVRGGRVERWTAQVLESGRPGCGFSVVETEGLIRNLETSTTWGHSGNSCKNN